MKEYYRWDRKHLRRPQWEEETARKAGGKQETAETKSTARRGDLHLLVLDPETVEILVDDKIATGG